MIITGLKNIGWGDCVLANPIRFNFAKFFVIKVDVDDVLILFNPLPPYFFLI